MIRAIRHLNIFKRLLFSSLVIILIPSAIIGLFSFTKFSTEMDSAISKYTYDLLRNIDGRIAGILREYDDLSNNLSINAELKSLLRKCRSLKAAQPMTSAQQEEYDSCRLKIGNILYEATLRHSYIQNLEIVNENDEFTMINFLGENVGAKLADPDDFRDTPWYRETGDALNRPVWRNTAKETMEFKSQQYPRGYIGNYVSLLRAIQEPKTEPLGIIVVNVSVNALYQRIGGIEEHTKGESLILLSQDGLICYFDPVFNFVALNRAAIDDILGKAGGSYIRKISNTEYLLTVFKSDYTGWYLCSIVPRQILLKSIYDIRDMIIFISALCVIAASVMAYLVTVSISSPLKKLKNTIEIVDEKNIETVYQDDIEDEVGILGQRFNHMIKRIQNLINTVYEAELAKKEEMLLRREAELDALQMQINPHFLYNTLDMIRWQAMSQENGKGKASQMISAFSDLLRSGTKIASSLVEVREELDHVNKYVEVVRFDLEYNLKVNYAIEDGRVLDCRIPKLTLQPLVENAIVHGFKHQRANGEIRISAHTEKTDLFIKINDNGEGIPEDVNFALQANMKEYQRKSKYIGLNNVNQRIKLYFGEQYGLSIESKQGEYTKVTVHIPIDSG